MVYTSNEEEVISAYVQNSHKKSRKCQRNKFIIKACYKEKWITHESNLQNLKIFKVFGMSLSMNNFDLLH